MSREENLVEIKQKEIEKKEAEIEAINRKIENTENDIKEAKSSVKANDFPTPEAYNEAFRVLQSRLAALEQTLLAHVQRLAKHE